MIQFYFHEGPPHSYENSVSSSFGIPEDIILDRGPTNHVLCINSLFPTIRHQCQSTADIWGPIVAYCMHRIPCSISPLALPHSNVYWNTNPHVPMVLQTFVGPSSIHLSKEVISRALVRLQKRQANNQRRPTSPLSTWTKSLVSQVTQWEAQLKVCRPFKDS